MGKMYFGTSYYPEHTEKEQIEKDIELMKNAGLNVIRTGEFAWSKIQPQEGVWDFSWLDEVIEKMAQSGIETIIGTPTAVPPKWLNFFSKSCCNRCGGTLENGRIMSMFNEGCICMKCSDEERKQPDFKKSC